MFKLSHPDLNEDTPKFKIPFLPNLKGESPIHRCLAKEDYKSIDTILRYLKFYPTDHHSRGIISVWESLANHRFRIAIYNATVRWKLGLS